MSRFFRYDHDTGEVVEVEKAADKLKARWPLASEAAAVHPSQIDEAREFNSRFGVRRTDYTPDGRPVFESPGHRREYLRAWKMHDRAGYD